MSGGQFSVTINNGSSAIMVTRRFIEVAKNDEAPSDDLLLSLLDALLVGHHYPPGPETCG
jgi:hypothetical protein